MQTTVHWRHHFHGDYSCSVGAFFEKQHLHLARAFGERILGHGFEIIETEDGRLLCKISTSETSALADRLEKARVENDRCSRCRQVHDIGDTAHSIDFATPIFIDYGEVPHPNQGVFFPT